MKMKLLEGTLRNQNFGFVEAEKHHQPTRDPIYKNKSLLRFQAFPSALWKMRLPSTQSCTYCLFSLFIQHLLLITVYSSF